MVFDLPAAIKDRDWLLPLKSNSLNFKLDGKRLLIDFLKEAWAKRFVNCNGRTDDSRRDVLVVHPRFVPEFLRS